MAATYPNSEDQTAAAPQVRVLIVDDSVVVRSLLQRWLAGCDDIEVVGAAGDGRAALQLLEQHDVDIVILDIAMPVMDGLTALPKIRERQPHAQVIISSTLTARNAEISLRALDEGAADYVTKPSGKEVVLEGQDFFAELLGKIRALGAVGQQKRLKRRVPVSLVSVKPQPVARDAMKKPALSIRDPARPLTFASGSNVPPEILAIGCSTGGPQALFRLLSDLPKPFPLPILIVQHMPPIFTDILAQQLSRSTGIETCEAKDGQRIFAGCAYLAPGDFHMRISREGSVARLVLTQDAPVNYCRPAVDPMFESVAAAFGQHVLAIVLTGMGKDGLAGARIIGDAHGTVIVQDEESSVVWGMPGAVATAGLASDMASLAKLADLIVKRLPGTAA